MAADSSDLPSLIREMSDRGCCDLSPLLRNALAKRLLESLGAEVVGFACVNLDAGARAHPELAGCRLESALEYRGPAGGREGERP